MSALDRADGLRDNAAMQLVPSEPSDEALMLAYARGETSAFERLYLRHKGPLYRYFVRLAPPPATAEELFQDCWARIVAARERYRADAKFTTYLYHVAHHLVVDHARRQRHREQPADDSVLVAFPGPDSAQPEPIVINAQNQARLRALLAELPADQASALLLQAEGELSLDEIAAVQGTGRETVKSRLRYAFAKLRKALQP